MPFHSRPRSWLKLNCANRYYLLLLLHMMATELYQGVHHCQMRVVAVGARRRMLRTQAAQARLARLEGNCGMAMR